MEQLRSRSNAFTVKLDGSATVQTQGIEDNSVVIKALDDELANKLDITAVGEKTLMAGKYSTIISTMLQRSYSTQKVAIHRFGYHSTQR